MRTTNITHLIAAMQIALATVVMADEPPAGGVPISFSVENPGQVSVAVYDQQGRQVRSLLYGEQRAAGEYSLSWDGLDREGRPVEPGPYTARLLQSRKRGQVGKGVRSI